jgi:PRTRC genetic system ThiF family protein
MGAKFDPNFHVNRIVLVGAGGTGAQWARSIARMLVDMRSRRMTRPEFVIVDPDRVEPKNVGRQLFTVADVGQFKAEILARRFNLALGLDVTWCNEPFVAKRFLRKSQYGHGVSTLWCGAVDNHEARQELNAVGYKAGQHQHIWIDAGNWPTGGQVIIGNTNAPTDVRIKANNRFEMSTAWLPTAYLLFPSLLEAEQAPAVAADASCADLLAAGEQHLLINDLMALAASQYTFKLLYRQEINSFITYCDIDMLSMRSIEISRENLEAYPLLQGLIPEVEEPTVGDDPLDRRFGAVMGVDLDDEDEEDDMYEDEELEEEWDE